MNKNSLKLISQISKIFDERKTIEESSCWETLTENIKRNLLAFNINKKNIFLFYFNFFKRVSVMRFLTFFKIYIESFNLFLKYNFIYIQYCAVTVLAVIFYLVVQLFLSQQFAVFFYNKITRYFGK